MLVTVYLSVTLGLSSSCFAASALLKYISANADSQLRGTTTLSVEHIAAIDVAGWTLLWYAISISFTLFNKWFMNVWQGGFHFPIFTTAIHMTIKVIISQVWAYCTKQELPPLSRRNLFQLVVPMGIATGLDIMLSNLSLEFISVTNYTLLKSTVLLWTFVWALVLGASLFEWRTFLSVVTISIGLGLATLRSTELEVVGTLFVLGASAMGGLRWALLQVLVLRDPVSKTTFGSIYRFSPASAAALIPLALYFDVPNVAASVFVDNHALLLLTALLWILIGGVFAFALIYVEVKLVQLTSSITLSVLGQLKDLMQITLGMLVFRDQLSCTHTTMLRHSANSWNKALCCRREHSRSGGMLGGSARLQELCLCASLLGSPAYGRISHRRDVQHLHAADPERERGRRREPPDRAEQQCRLAGMGLAGEQGAAVVRTAGRGGEGLTFKSVKFDSLFVCALISVFSLFVSLMLTFILSLRLRVALNLS